MSCWKISEACEMLRGDGKLKKLFASSQAFDHWFSRVHYKTQIIINLKAVHYVDENQMKIRFGSSTMLFLPDFHYSSFEPPSDPRSYVSQTWNGLKWTSHNLLSFVSRCITHNNKPSLMFQWRLNGINMMIRTHNWKDFLEREFLLYSKSQMMMSTFFP